MAAHTEPDNVLIVDDDAMSRDLLALLLEAEGYAVETADSGEAALVFLKGVHPVPAIVLTDIKMPGISGDPLAEQLRQRCGPETILLAMSGSSPAADSIRRYDGFLLKPFTMDLFELAVSACSSQSPASKALPERTPFPASAPLDESIYSKLTLTMQTDQLIQLYSLCLSDARSRISALRQALEDGDSASFVHQAHAIKGSAGMLGASEIYGLAANLENKALATPGLGFGTDGASGVGEADSLLPKSAKKVNPLDELSLACDRLERILLARATLAVQIG